MTYRTVFQLALKNIRSQKRRSFLTMLGVIIGIMAVIIVVAAGNGAKGFIVGQIASRGTDQIAVLAGSSDEKGPPAQALGIVITTLTHDDAKALLDRKNTRYIVDAAAYISGNDVISWEGAERQVTYTGTTASYQTIEKVTVAEGSFFSESDEETGARVVVLGATIADELFGNQHALGETVKLAKKHFRVVGILAPQGSSGFENPDTQVFIPLSVAQRELLGVRHVSFLRLRADAPEHVEASVQEIRDTLVERHGEEDFSIRTIADLLQIVNVITSALTLFLSAVAGIALFVGGVGIMNIMIIAVKERTREIGLRKAVGARDVDILRQFLIETMVITGTGAVLGIVAGLVVSFMIVFIAQALGFSFPFTIPMRAIAVSLLVAALIGFGFGIVPARRAARLSPMVALRYE